MKGDVFRIAHGFGRDFAVDGEGQGIWGARDEAELRSRVALSRRLRVPVSLEEASDGPLIPRRPGLVIGVGLTSSSICEVYSALTSRAFVNVVSERDLVGLSGVAVVLTRADLVSASLLQTLYAGKERETEAPGLIFASDEERLLRVAKRIAAGLLRRGRLPLEQAVVSEFEHAHSSGPSGWESVGPDSSALETQSVLSSEVEFLAVSGHSDGIHLSLPGAGMVCPLQPGDARGEGLQPYCITEQSCPRYAHRPALSEAWREEFLVDPSALGARVFYNGGCFAFRVDDGVVDPKYSLACAIAERSNVLALVGSWASTLSDPTVPERLLRPLAAGASLGLAVGEYNKLDMTARGGRLLAYLGDPAYEIPPPLSQRTWTFRTRRGTESRVGACEMTQRSSAGHFIETCVLHGLATNLFCDEEAARSVQAGLADAERAAESGLASSQAFRLALLKYFASFSRFSNAWGEKDGRTRVAEIGRPCPFCGSSCILYEHSFEYGYGRQSLACPRCDEVMNSASDSVPEIVLDEIEKGILKQRGAKQGTSARVALVSRYMPESVGFHWPNDLADEMSTECGIPLGAVPSGQLICRVLFASGTDISCLSFKARAEKGRFRSSVEGGLCR